MSTTCNCETPELEKSGLVAVQPKASTSTWAIDRVHSTAQFKVKHMMISNVSGEFTPGGSGFRPILKLTNG
jgi:polyisoprenoid-binding protein YceI